MHARQVDKVLVVRILDRHDDARGSDCYPSQYSQYVRTRLVVQLGVCTLRRAVFDLHENELDDLTKTIPDIIDKADDSTNKTTIESNSVGQQLSEKLPK